jgi:hypothetical protein
MLTTYVDEINGIITVGFDVIDQLLIRYSAFVRYWRKYRTTVGLDISYLFTVRTPVTQGRAILQHSYCAGMPLN